MEAQQTYAKGLKLAMTILGVFAIAWTVVLSAAIVIYGAVMILLDYLMAIIDFLAHLRN